MTESLAIKPFKKNELRHYSWANNLPAFQVWAFCTWLLPVCLHSKNLMQKGRVGCSCVTITVFVYLREVAFTLRWLSISSFGMQSWAPSEPPTTGLKSSAFFSFFFLTCRTSERFCSRSLLLMKPIGARAAVFRKSIIKSQRRRIWKAHIICTNQR